jgi:hypothetical protein
MGVDSIGGSRVWSASVGFLGNGTIFAVYKRVQTVVLSVITALKYVCYKTCRIFVGLKDYIVTNRAEIMRAIARLLGQLFCIVCLLMILSPMLWVFRVWHLEYLTLFDPANPANQGALFFVPFMFMALIGAGILASTITLGGVILAAGYENGVISAWGRESEWIFCRLFGIKDPFARDRERNKLATEALSARGVTIREFNAERSKIKKDFDSELLLIKNNAMEDLYVRCNTVPMPL